jgi:hypothetical protein
LHHAAVERSVHQRLAMRKLAVGIFALLVAACGDGASGEVRVSATPRIEPRIVGGSPSTSAKDAVVFLNLGNDGFCTATLIAPTLLITARHCVAQIDESGACGTFGANNPTSTMSVAIGVQASEKSPAVARGKRIFVEPATDGCGTDIALLEIDTAITSVPPATVRLTAPVTGEAASTVGYGDDGRGQVTNGRYERTGLKIDAVGPATATYRTKTGQNLRYDVAAAELSTGESTCFGDSGGPLFDAQGAIIGVTSRGIDGSCLDRPSIYSGTAGHAKLINDALAAVGAITPGGSNPPPDQPGSSTNDDDTGGLEEGDPVSSKESGDEPATPTTPRATKRSQAPASSGCTASPAGASGSSLAPIGAALALAAALRRRRR